MGHHLVHRRERHRHAARRLARVAVWIAARADDQRRRLHRGLGGLRLRDGPGRDGGVSRRAGPVRRGARAAGTGCADARIPARAARARDGAVDDGRAGGSHHRADARRLPHRHPELALGILHQRADRRARVFRPARRPGSRARRPEPSVRLHRLRAAVTVARPVPADDGPRPDAGLVRLHGDRRRSVLCGHPVFHVLRRTRRRPSTRSSTRACSRTATSSSRSR